MQGSDANKCRGVLRGRAPVRGTITVPPLLDFGRIGRRVFGERLRVQFREAPANLNSEHVFAKSAEAFADFFRIGQLIDARFPRVGNKCVVDDRGIGIVDRKKLETDLSGELIAIVALVGKCRAGGERLAFKFFLICVAAEVVLFFEKKKILPAQEISSREAGHAATDNNDGRFLRGGRDFESMAVAQLVANVEVFAVDERRRYRIGSSGEKCGIDGAAGRDRTGDDVLDEVTARMRHAIS